MGRKRRRETDKAYLSYDGRYVSLDTNNNKHGMCFEEAVAGEWLATDRYLPSALEQAYHFINSGELDSVDYYLVRWRYYEQSHQSSIS
tara:strand:- start:219 stop:482 length:264 start_codon:yes stop_codon:yes gene_type:complete